MREATDSEALAAALRRLGENDEEIKMLRESRAAAVSQEQTSRVECNRLRGELAAVTAEARDTKILLAEKNETANVFMGQVRKLQADLSKAQAACAEMREVIGKLVSRCEWNYHNDDPILPSYIEHALSSTCGQPFLDKHDRMGTALAVIGDRSTSCPGHPHHCNCDQHIARRALKGQP